MKGMAIVGNHKVPAEPPPGIAQGFIDLGNQYFNDQRYADAIFEYNRALGMFCGSRVDHRN